ncbi:MAG: DUF4293 domain-containing protein [Bacteroidales bacterium]|jgi:hypothetical protein|nr:DUF4293 domain-containing protein [Bacteroidales bacterium]
MIQRIQTLLFFVAAICFTVACFMPVGTITTHDAYYLLDSWTLKENIPDGAVVYPTYFIGILQIMLALTSFVAIFLYKKRSTQSKLCIAAIFGNFVLILLMLWGYPDYILPKMSPIAHTEMVSSLSLWAMLSVLPLGCLYFANKYIIKDEKKIRAADRLR